MSELFAISDGNAMKFANTFRHVGNTGLCS